MKKSSNSKTTQAPTNFTKRALIVLFCLAVLACLATSCYTTQRCPAYGNYTYVAPLEVERK